MKIIGYIKKIKLIIDKYEVGFIASSTAFYMIVAIFSLSILGLQFFNYFYNNGIFIKIINIINPYYTKSLEQLIPVFTISKYSPVLLINLIWSSSKFINGFNKASDIIYHFSKKRNFIINRISSILIFILILLVISFEFITIFYANQIISYIINNIYVFMVLQFIVDIFLIFTIVIILNMYVPPLKMNFKKVFIGSLVSTVFIYVLLIVFIVIVYVLKQVNINFNIISLISLLFLLIYFINFFIVMGIYLNYHLQKHPN